MRLLDTTLVVLLAGTASAALPSYITANNSPAPTDAAFISRALKKSNDYRAEYGAAPLVWSAQLAQVALKKSNGCTLNHTGDYGENAYTWWTIPPTSKPDFGFQLDNAFDEWMSPEEIAAYRNGDLLGGAHFTQMVWKASKRVGCAFSTDRCKNNDEQEWWFYCDYDPPGNVLTLFEENVQL
ncbi:CAP domain-containing protein [Podospora conica]|nr:CAP domain-containing protein [Schizothecium conicum]